jgi:hypothetical protein
MGRRSASCSEPKKRVSKRRWWYWLCLLAAVLLAVWLYDISLTIMWAGSAPMEIEFRVADASTGQPIESATIEVRAEDGSCEEGEPGKFRLQTNRDGVVKRVCRHCFAHGTQSGLRLLNSFNVRVPRWKFRVSAAGYPTSAWMHLAEERFSRHVQQRRAGVSRLVVHLSLFRPPGEQGADAPRSPGHFPTTAVSITRIDRHFPCRKRSRNVTDSSMM